MIYFEVIGAGFDATFTADKADPRLIWVSAPSIKHVKALLANVPNDGIRAFNDRTVTPWMIDFTLPQDDARLCARLREYATVSDTALLDFVLPILQGDSDPEANRRTIALMGALMLNKSGREAIIHAMQAFGEDS